MADWTAADSWPPMMKSSERRARLAGQAKSRSEIESGSEKIGGESVRLFGKKKILCFVTFINFDSDDRAGLRFRGTPKMFSALLILMPAVLRVFLILRRLFEYGLEHLPRAGQVNGIWK